MDVEVALGSFYSQGDERRLFQGLKENAAVKEVEGVGINLIIRLELRFLSKERIRELLALLWRYGIPLAPLYLLAEKKKFAWLNDSRAYWYKSLFDVKTRTRTRVYNPNLRAGR